MQTLQGRIAFDRSSEAFLNIYYNLIINPKKNNIKSERTKFRKSLEKS